MKYDSRVDTWEHIHRVQLNLREAIDNLLDRLMGHDLSKLSGVEKEAFDIATPRLAEAEYGSDEYRSTLREIKPAIEQHYQKNPHHPEHYDNGIAGMTLFDLVEMLCDWEAATWRSPNGDINKSLEHNAQRFKISEQLVSVLDNTITELFGYNTPSNAGN